MLILAEKELKVNMYGKEVCFRYPTSVEVDSYRQKAIKKDDSEINLSLDFLHELGMPKDMRDKIYPDHLKEILLTLLGQKKTQKQ